jgi:hypothetical protein
LSGVNVEAVEDYHPGTSSSAGTLTLDLKDSILKIAEEYPIWTPKLTHG